MSTHANDNTPGQTIEKWVEETLEFSGSPLKTDDVLRAAGLTGKEFALHEYRKRASEAMDYLRNQK